MILHTISHREQNRPLLPKRPRNWVTECNMEELALKVATSKMDVVECEMVVKITQEYCTKRIDLAIGRLAIDAITRHNKKRISDAMSRLDKAQSELNYYSGLLDRWYPSTAKVD